LSSVNTVPSEVEDSADPAANACRAGNDPNGMRMNDNAIGTSNPVRAITVDMSSSEVRFDNDDVIPPK
jgi:hypothetical protein